MELIPERGNYKIKDLYIKQKYSTFKQEILNYPYITIKQYKNEILTKAKTYHNTNYAKSIIAKERCIPPSYGISKGSLITISHLISVILYTDYSNLSSHFSSTFRKNGPFDTLENVKNRNRRYFWMSKLLRETVEIFGECHENNGLVGPFYSGISRVINFANFFLRLSSPTSTTIHIEVAMKFSGDNGIIIQLDNPSGNGLCRYLRGFNCSWISRYKEEDERCAQLSFDFGLMLQ